MLPNNFENIAAEHPDLRPSLARISDWIDRHRDWTVLDPRVLAKDLSPINPYILSRALTLLVSSGLFKTVYKLVEPSGTLSRADFDDPADVPEFVYDRWDRPIETAESDLIAVLSSARKDSQLTCGA